MVLTRAQLDRLGSEGKRGTASVIRQQFARYGICSGSETYIKTIPNLHIKGENYIFYPYLLSVDDIETHAALIARDMSERTRALEEEYRCPIECAYRCEQRENTVSAHFEFRVFGTFTLDN